MRGPKPTPIALSDRQRSVLDHIVRRHTSPQQQVRRAKLILSMAEGKNNQQTAQHLGVHRETVQQWRHRWLAEVPRLTAAEVSGLTDKEILAMIEQTLCDHPREGSPVKFTAEQVAQILALACSSPEKSGRPITHWSGGELAQEAVKRGIVESISPRSVERFLKRSGLEAPYQSLLAQCESSRP